LSCFDSYITLNSSTTSRSGRYVSDLPGIDTEMIADIARSTDEDEDDIFPVLYRRAYKGLISDATKLLQKKFFVDSKLVSRETSKYLEDWNSNSGLAGVSLEYTLPRYAKQHVIKLEVFSATSYISQAIFYVYEDDEDGELLDTITTAITAGRNTINIDTDYEVDKIFIAYNPALFTLRQTENRSYRTPYNSFSSVICDFCYFEDYSATIQQINGGGVNAHFMVYCSSEKFVCENIKLFEDALLFRIGYEITVERRLGERLNRFTILSQERWQELETFYRNQYQQDLDNSINSTNIPEDQVCYSCKSSVYVQTQIP